MPESEKALDSGPDLDPDSDFSPRRGQRRKLINSITYKVILATELLYIDEDFCAQ